MPIVLCPCATLHFAGVRAASVYNQNLPEKPPESVLTVVIEGVKNGQFCDALPLAIDQLALSALGK